MVASSAGLRSKNRLRGIGINLMMASLACIAGVVLSNVFFPPKANIKSEWTWEAVVFSIVVFGMGLVGAVLKLIGDFRDRRDNAIVPADADGPLGSPNS